MQTHHGQTYTDKQILKRRRRKRRQSTYKYSTLSKCWPPPRPHSLELLYKGGSSPASSLSITVTLHKRPVGSCAPRKPPLPKWDTHLSFHLSFLLAFFKEFLTLTDASFTQLQRSFKSCLHSLEGSCDREQMVFITTDPPEPSTLPGTGYVLGDYF